ncbi:MAG: CoB--CoM heterodisulfide reductase iron-sulfur subunit A family protein [Desulfobacterales bacterium]|nr:CoB--CoM heterodisulfide reductase iron-sulfur subunit A family protein [Desulfobacterales bacterium]
MGHNNKVLIIGGGIAGLSVALELSNLGTESIIIEKSHNIGGHAAQFACKAATKCVKCGACIVYEKIQSVLDGKGIIIHTDSHVKKITRVHANKYNVTIEQNNQSDNPQETEITLSVDAVVLSTGFKPFDPIDKPYGYRIFDDVITNLELERILKKESILKKPSNNELPKKIAFIQCVGSRDSTLNHLWCSKVCCPSALRMANLIKMRQKEVEISFFYIDVQSFGKDFLENYHELKQNIRMIRSIPGDVIKTDEGLLQITYFDNTNKQSADELFDIIILSIGITPNTDANKIADTLGMEISDLGFIKPSIFTAGSATGPMNIPETISNAGKTALNVYNYLKDFEKELN